MKKMAEEITTNSVTNEKKAKEKKILTPEQKKKKSRRIRWSIILLLIAAVVAYSVVSRVKAQNAPTYVETASVRKGTIEQTVKTSGTIETENKTTYFAAIAAPIGKLNVKVGDVVAKGDVLLSYDTDKLTLSKKQAELSAKQADGLKDAYGDKIPLFDLNDGRYKISTGWLIDKAGLKGVELHGMCPHFKNALVLTNVSARNFNDLALAREEIKSIVKGKFGIEIEQEPLEI